MAFAISLAPPLHGAPAAAPTKASVASTMPPKVYALLLEEMNAILRASQTILDALVRGQHEVVAEQAQGIHDSFIMAKKMTAADREALHAGLPKSFVEQDHAFHTLAGRLAEAAREGDALRQRKLFYSMIDACAACHAQHASNRFPGVSRSAPPKTSTK